MPLLRQIGVGAAALILIGLAATMLLVLHALAVTANSGRSWLGRLLGREPAPECDLVQVVQGRHLLSLVPVAAASWIAGVAALYVILRAMRPDLGLGIGVVIGAAALASTIGSLAVVVPEGIGVSEGVLTGVLVHATTLPLADCMAAALAMRALDPLTKLSLLGIVTGTHHPAVARHLAYAGERAEGLVCRWSIRSLALAAAITSLRGHARLRWLPLAVVGLGLAAVVRLPYLRGMSLPDIDF
jgi:hypothetical protein